MLVSHKHALPNALAAGWVLVGDLLQTAEVRPGGGLYIVCIKGNNFFNVFQVFTALTLTLGSFTASPCECAIAALVAQRARAEVT